LSLQECEEDVEEEQEKEFHCVINDAVEDCHKENKVEECANELRDEKEEEECMREMGLEVYEKEELEEKEEDVDLQNSDVEKSVKVNDTAADAVESEDKEWPGDLIIGAFRNVFFEGILSLL
jgi:hypothetical protein